MIRAEFVRTDERTSVVTVEPDELLLEAAERMDVALPFGCRIGACSTCAGRLRSGTVTHIRPPRALKECHLREGYILTCIATPTTDCCIEVGPDVQAELVENPWR
jgi:ferredoxin